MKKVIGVAVAASLVAGMAFADVAINMRARERLNAYHVKTLEAEDTNGYDKYTYTFDMNGKAGHGGSGTFADDIILTATTDYAGVVYKFNLGANAYNKDDDEFQNFVNSDKAYSAWMKFGGLKLTFGQFDSRYISLYDKTATQSGLLDSDYAKYGLIQTVGASKIGKDANNFSAVEGTRKNTLVADYTFDDVAGGKLLVKGALVGDPDNNYDDEDADKVQFAGYAFEADFSNDSVNLQALVKKLNKDTMQFGAYVEPLVLPVKTAFGFTYVSGKDFDYGTSGVSDASAWAIDARFQMPVSEQLLVTAIAKYESTKVKEKDDTDTAFDVGAEISYDVSDKVVAVFDFMYANADLDDKDGGAVTGKASKFQIRPAVQFTAGKGANLTAAFQYDSYLDKDDRETKTEYSIPVIFRVQL